MLKVKTKLKPSKIHGIGLFADQDIRKGAIVWEFTRFFDRRYTTGAVRLMPSRVRQYMKRYSWKSIDTGLILLCNDQASYFNHSDTPNCYSGNTKFVDGERVTIALRNILKGEELTDDYNSFAA